MPLPETHSTPQVLAYGQTGSGKTHTMGTSCGLDEFLSMDPAGVVPRTLLVLFKYIGVASQVYDVTIKVWMLG